MATKIQGSVYGSWGSQYKIFSHKGLWEINDYHCYTTLAILHEPHTYREASTNPSWQIAMKEELNALSKNHTRDLVTLPLGNLWLVVNRSSRLRLALMGPLSATKLVLLQKVLHKSIGLIMKRGML